MAIDGRAIGGRQPAERLPEEAGAGIKVLAWLAVLVPLALIVWGTYVIGTWTGGWMGGVASVVTTLISCVGIWWWRRGHKH